jgi:hypothetical protein
MPEENTVHLNPMSGEDSDLDPDQERIVTSIQVRMRAHLDPVLPVGMGENISIPKWPIGL